MYQQQQQQQPWFKAVRNPSNTKVNHFISGLTERERYIEIIDVDQWEPKFVSDMNKRFPITIPDSHSNNQFPVSVLNSHPNNQIPVLIPKSHPNNQFSTSVEPSKAATNETIYGFRNLKRQKRMDVNQYTGVPNGFVSLMASGSHSSDSSMDMGCNGQNLASNNISNPQYLGGSSLNEFNQKAYNMAFPTSLNNVQSLHSNQSSLKLNFNYNNEDIHVKYASQRKTNPGTYLRPRGQMSAPLQQPNQQTCQLPLQLSGRLKGQSNVFKTPHVNVWEPTQRQPRAAEETCDLSIYRKHKRKILDFLGESWEEGTLFDVLRPFYKLPRLEEYASKSDEDLSAVKTEPLGMSLGTKANDIITEGATGSNEQISKGSEGNGDNTMKDEFSEPPEFRFDDKTSDGREESSQAGPVVNCGINRNSDGYKSTVEPMECMTTHQNASSVDTDMVWEYEIMKTQTTSFNNNETGSGSGHIKIQSVSLVDCEVASESEHTEAHTACFDDNSSGSGSGITKILSVTSVDHEMVSEFKNINGESSGLRSGNMKIPSISADCDMVSESKKTKVQVACSEDKCSELRSGNMKIPSVSLADSITASQIKQHLSSFNQDNRVILKNKDTSSNPDLCELCWEERLMLAPTPIYCEFCDFRIPLNALYHRSPKQENKDTKTSTDTDTKTKTVKDTKPQHCICTTCYKVSGSTIILPKGGSISKVELEKAKNDQERDDGWVECDRCNKWQHYICGLYNKEQDQGEGEYICSKCRLIEIEEGKWAPQAVLAAKDLPRSNLSDHIEQRLATRMKQEREETAKSQGTELKDVAEAEGLVVRVVLSVDKELEVKQQFRDIFEGKDYPEKLKYRSKLILLFQRLGGVDVCIFGIYVQEYGSECSGPNNRCVYISYLDSVKYFQPERKTSSGESLRTFVYHEILIGYLEHCKKRGFSTCYIWSCPIVKGQDYIFNCRPKTQKTPKEDKLLKWYKLMLTKAAKEGIVVDVNNLHKQFFVPKREENNKITAARLPYFDGAYWLGAAEIISKKLEEEESSGKLCIKSPKKRTFKALGRDNPTKDVLVMQQLGDKIMANKENLMIVHLQQTCTSCHEEMLCGSRWFCNQCNKIQLCSRCYDSGKLLSPQKMHKCHSGKKNGVSELRQLSEGILSNVPRDTTDRDGLLINNFFETRDDFLNKCEIFQYQFNTLAHAKYSSMMILYHFTHMLVIQPVCTLCNNHVLIDQCWHCDSCPDLHVCESCYETKGHTCHNHKLTHPSTTSEITKNKEPEKQNVMLVNAGLDPLVHVCRCRNDECTYPWCQTIKELLQHGHKCPVRAINGCGKCKKAWNLLMKHSQICADPTCKVPNCTKLKEQRTKVTASSSENKQIKRQRTTV